MACVRGAVCAFILFAVASRAQTTTSRVPRFEDYAVDRSHDGVAASAKLSSAVDAWPDSDPRFREALTDALKAGANFAGHFTIVQWSCGTGCGNSLVTDTETGVIYRQSPFYSLFVGYDETSSEYSGLSYKPNSRLLIAEGCFGERGPCARRYYVWGGKVFKLVRNLAFPRR